MRLVCNLDVLTPEERRRSRELLCALRASVVERRPLPDGLAFSFGPGTSLASLGEWMALERRCCPFLRFRLEVEGAAGPVWLGLAGPEGVRELFAAALSPPAAPS